MWSSHKRETVVLELDDPIPAFGLSMSPPQASWPRFSESQLIPLKYMKITVPFFFLEWRMNKWWEFSTKFLAHKKLSNVCWVCTFLNWNKKGWNSNTQMVLKSRFNAIKITSNSQKTITQNTIVTLEHIITKICFIIW